jgi:hypothetical protein
MKMKMFNEQRSSKNCKVIGEKLHATIKVGAPIDLQGYIAP